MNKGPKQSVTMLSPTPVAHDDFVTQLLSGWRDPRIEKDKPYSLEDYQNIAVTLLAYPENRRNSVSANDPSNKFLYDKTPPKIGISPAQLFGSVLDLLRDNNMGNDQKQVILKNLSILLPEIIRSDVTQRYIKDIQSGMNELRALKADLPPEVQSAFQSFDYAVSDAISDSQKQKNNSTTQLAASAEQVDIESFVKQLQTKGASSSAITRNAALLAQDLKAIQHQMLGNMDIAPYQSNRFVEEKVPKGSIVNIRNEHFNKINEMATVDILSTQKSAARKQVYSFYMEVMEECIKNGNYPDALTLFNALYTSVPIIRLKLATPKQEKRLMELGLTLFSPTKNYNNLRTHLNQAANSNKLPVFTSVVLQRDLTPIFDRESKVEVKGNQGQSVKKPNDQFLIDAGRILRNTVVTSQQSILAQPINATSSNIDKRIANQPIFRSNLPSTAFEFASKAIVEARGDLKAPLNVLSEFKKEANKPYRESLKNAANKAEEARSRSNSIDSVSSNVSVSSDVSVASSKSQELPPQEAQPQAAPPPVAARPTGPAPQPPVPARPTQPAPERPQPSVGLKDAIQRERQKVSQQRQLQRQDAFRQLQAPPAPPPKPSAAVTESALKKAANGASKAQESSKENDATVANAKGSGKVAALTTHFELATQANKAAQSNNNDEGAKATPKKQRPNP